MFGKFFSTRWSAFVLGIVVGSATLSACAAITTATPTEVVTETGTESAQPTETQVQPQTQPPVQAAPGESTLDTVKTRGTVKCGVNPGLAGFSTIDANGRQLGFDVDFCRALAAAVFNDTEKVEFIPLTTDQRLPALQAGEVDVLIRNTTWTLTRDSTNGLDFTVTNFYDGQGYLVNKKFATVEDLNGAKVCVLSGTTSEQNLADDFARRNISYEAVVLSKSEETFSSLADGSCDAVTSDKSQLAAGLSSMPEDKRADFVILPDTISKEPLGPVVRQNDSRWRDVVVWTLYAMIEAEELGINQANVDSFKTSTDVTVQRLLGTHEKDDLGAGLSLSKDWAYNVIKLVGNYGDVYNRNLTPIGIGREGTLNALWIDGGLMYSPAYR